MTIPRSHKPMPQIPSDALQALLNEQPVLKKYLATASQEVSQKLMEQIESLNIDFFKRIAECLEKQKNPPQSSLEGKLTPPNVIRFSKKGSTPTLWNTVRERGIQALKKGKVGVVTVAGGQGTRLGHSGPKGTYPVTPLTHKTLFQVFAEKILAAEKRYGNVVHWAIMTSPANHDETCDFFKKNKHFGLKPEAVYFFNQNVLPATDFKGNWLLQSPQELSLTADGHGGFFKAFVQADLVEKMRYAGVDTLSYFQIDNPLTQPLDPVFLGFHRLQESEFSSKTVRRRDAYEKVGIFVQVNDKLHLIEYSDAPKTVLEQLNPKKELKFPCANIAVHALDLDFVERVAFRKLPYHTAIKKIPYWDPIKGYCEPQEPNGIKFEQFIFDALPLARNPILLEVLREDSFSPVKNAQGPDSPETCTADQIALWKRWLMEAGVTTEGPIEISPLWADNPEEVANQVLAHGLQGQLRSGTVLA